MSHPPPASLTRAPASRAAAWLGAVALGVVVATGGVAHAEDPPPEVKWRFQAQRHLRQMGIRHVVPTERTASAGRDARGSLARAPEFQGRVTAPALAYLHGLSDLEGGLPDFRATVFFVVREGGAVQVRTDRAGTVVDLRGQRTGVRVYDGARLPRRVQTVD